MKHRLVIAAILSLAAMAAVPAMAAKPAQPRSLVVGSWPDDMPSFPCDPGDMCVTNLQNAELVGAKSLSGPAVPGKLRIHFGMHATPIPGTRVVVVVERGTKGEWQALWLNHVEPGAEDCYSSELLAEWKVSVPAGARKQGDEFCFIP